MDLAEVYESYYNAVFDTDRDEALQVIDMAIDKGAEPEKLVFDVVLPSLDAMLQAISRDDNATLSQHFIAAKVAGEIVTELIARFKTFPTSSGIVVIGTAAGDFHGLGKKIVASCLKANMFTVHDAGLNVYPREFVDLAEDTGASVIGISSMMMHTTLGEDGPRGVRRELARRNLEDRIRIIVGGAPYRFDPNLYKKVQADAFAEHALLAVAAIKAIEPREKLHA